MRELPMLLNGHGVRVTLAGTKVQTRRPMKPQPTDYDCEWVLLDKGRYISYAPVRRMQGMSDALWHNGIRCPFGVPGDLLYVRETWYELPDGRIGYRASPETNNWGPFCLISTWRASIHMPKKYARTWLRNTGVRVERVQDISEEDVLAEGVRRIEEVDEDLLDYKVYFESGVGRSTCPFEAYAYLWDSIYAKKGLGWDANPWVWVTSYEVIER